MVFKQKIVVHTQCGIEEGFIQKARQKVVVAFLGKMAAQLRLFIKTVLLLKLFTLSVSSVLELWSLTLKEAGSNLLVIFKFFH